MKNNYSAK